MAEGQPRFHPFTCLPCQVSPFLFKFFDKEAHSDSFKLRLLPLKSTQIQILAKL